MVAKKKDATYLELYDFSRKELIVKAPLSEIRFIPRVGERILIPVGGPNNWETYTVDAVEYFIGYGRTGQPARPSSEGHGKVTLYIKRS